MKLAAKLVLVFLVGVLLIVCLFSWQMIDIQRRWADQREQEHAADLVNSLMPTMIEAYRSGGVIQVQRSIEFSTREIDGPKLRWIDPDRLVGELGPPADGDARLRITAKQTTRLLVSDSNGNGRGSSYIFPLSIDGQDSGAIEVAEASHDGDQFVRRSLIASLISLLGVSGLCAVVIYWNGVRMVAQPLTQLINQVERIGYGDLEPQPLPDSDDELGQLAIEINLMRQRLIEQRETIQVETQTRLETQDQLRHADRLGTVGTLAAGLAHELGTPLNVVAGRADLIAGQRLSTEEVNTSAQTIKSEAKRMTGIIRQLLDFARQSTPRITPTSATELVEKTCELIRPLASKSNVGIDFASTGDPMTIVADSSQIQQVITNLLTNAIQAMPSGGPIEVAVGSSSNASPVDVPPSEDGFVCISIRDQGAGMSNDDVEQIFEPFFTTKETGQGTGLGLSIAYGIVREHHGWIDVTSTLGEGTMFRVFLPAARQASPAEVGSPPNRSDTTLMDASDE
jgi:two-component system NtrC family sensor kinase